MYKILILSILLAACAPQYIDPRLEESVADFEQYMGVTVDFDVTAKDFKRNINGLCQVFPVKKVVIHEQWADFAAQEDRFNKWIIPIVYHELSHCVFGLTHDNSVLENGDPASWMWPDGEITQDWSEEEVEYYKQELKDRYRATVSQWSSVEY